MISGQVVKCGHCKGYGTCVGSSCKACVVKAGLDPKETCRDITCSACGGIGSAWVGPPVVQIMQEMKEQ